MPLEGFHLDFERPLLEIESKIRDLEYSQKNGVENLDDELSLLRKKLDASVMRFTVL